jgi:hypothetical protein
LKAADCGRRKKVNAGAQNLDDGVRDVSPMFDRFPLSDDASNTRLGVRATPGKEKKDEILANEFISHECCLSHRRSLPNLRCPHTVYYMECRNPL